MIIKSGRPTLPQFRYRDVINEFDAGPLASPGPTTFFADFLGDVRILYVTLRHVSGGAKTLQLNATLDGTTIGTGAALNDNTLYYVFISPTGQTHSYTTDRTLYSADESQYAQSFGNLSITAGNPDIDNVRLIVRYVQL